MSQMKVFVAYHMPADEQFVHRVYYYLKKQPGLLPYFYGDDPHAGSWRDRTDPKLREALAFVLFVGNEIGKTQAMEAHTFDVLASQSSESMHHEVVVRLHEGLETPIDNNLKGFRDCDPIHVVSLDDSNREREAQNCARQIALNLLNVWAPPYGLPLGYPFDYEKAIIEEYAKGGGHLSGHWLELGCPAAWPGVERVADEPFWENPVPEDDIGARRGDSEKIIVDVRGKYHRGANGGCLIQQHLAFPEAGPRLRLCYPKGQNLRVGILVSGGIAPGINAVIAGIVQRHNLYCRRHTEKHAEAYALSVYGYRDGLEGVLRSGANRLELDEDTARRNANLGGSMLGTSRNDKLLEGECPELRRAALRAVVDNIAAGNLDILYVIGGEGSMRAAHAMWKMAQEAYRGDKNLSVVAIPKTMDNDILWVWQSFGFLSAVEKAKEFVLQLYTEATSNPRLCVMQLFGSDSGFVVSHAALASGVCDAALVPEVPFSMRGLSDYIGKKLRWRYQEQQRGFGLILAAETAVPTDYEGYVNDPEVGLDAAERAAIDKFVTQDKRRVHGQTPDALRTGGLKIVSRVLQREIRSMGEYDPYWLHFRVFSNEPRHLLRAIGPSVSDVLFGQRLGTLAVDNAMAGYTDFMISQWLTEYVLVPLPLVVLGRKRVPPQGIFWKSVRANTGQPPIL